MATMTPTDTELLALVKQAIGGTLTRNAGAYSVGGKRLDSIPLPELIALRNDLELRVARAQGGYADVARFQGPC
jgi:hypothetical protein